MIRLLALSLGLTMAIACCEIGLRILGISYPLPYQTDPYCGTKLQPHFSGWFTKEGRAYIQTTSDGRRDREYPHTKAPNTLRIAILGDSYAEALQVEQAETFWSVLQSELKSCDKLQERNIEVLNFGVSGFGTAQELQMLEHYVWAYQPDIVLLALLTGNDISDNSKKLSSNQARPFYRLENEELVLDDSFRVHPTYLASNSAAGKFKTLLINRSRTLQLLRETLTRWRERSSPSATTPSTELGLDPIYKKPETADWIEAWSITERLLQRMHVRTQEQKSLFGVVTLSNAIQVDPDVEKRELVQKSHNVENLFYAEERLIELGKRWGFPVFPLAPDMQKEAERTEAYFHGFSNTKLGTGHWNAHGHRVAGEILAKRICHWLSP